MMVLVMHMSTTVLCFAVSIGRRSNCSGQDAILLQIGRTTSLLSAQNSKRVNEEAGLQRRMIEEAKEMPWMSADHQPPKHHVSKPSTRLDQVSDNMAIALPKQKTIILIVLFCALVAFAVVCWCSQSEQSPPREPDSIVRVASKARAHMQAAVHLMPTVRLDGLLPPCSPGRKRVQGEIALDSGSTQYAIISAGAAAEDVIHHVFQPGFPGFGLHKAPCLILSVTGGAAGLEQYRRHFDMDSFCSSLVSVAVRTDAWVVTGGTKSGVMDLVGQAMRKHDKFRRVPCLGITAFGALTTRWREELVATESCEPVVCKESVSEYHKVSKGTKEDWSESHLAEPQDNHTHIVFCDSGKEGKHAYGDEIKFRSEFELCMEERKGASRVMILVNGGVVSLQTLDGAVQCKCPIVICKGSGRCADAIVACLEYLRSGGHQEHGSGHRSFTRRGSKGNVSHSQEVIDGAIEAALVHFSDKDRANFSEENRAALLRIAQSNVVWVYYHGKKFHLEDIILQAIFENSQKGTDMRSQLKLAVQWRCTHCFEFILQYLMEEHCDKEIKWIFETFIGQVDEEYEVLRNTSPAVVALVECLVSNFRGSLQKFEVKNNLGNFVGSDYLHGRGNTLNGIILWAIDQTACLEVLEAIWAELDEPVHAALVVAGICRSKASMNNDSYKQAMEDERLQAVADKFEQLAIFVLEDLVNTFGRLAIDYVFRDSASWKVRDHSNNCLMLAHTFSCKSFIATPPLRLAVEHYYLTPSPFQSNKTALDTKYLSSGHLLMLPFSFHSCNLSLSELFATPYIKSRTHTIFRFAFTVTYIVAVMSGKLSHAEVSSISVVLFVWACGFAQVELQQYMQELSSLEYFCDWWNAIDFIYLSVLLAAILVGWIWPDHSETVTPLETALAVMHSLNLLPCSLRLMHSLLLFEYFGVLVIITLQMLKDTFYWFVLLTFLVLAFSFSLTPILFEHWQDRNVFWAFWSLFSDGDGSRDIAKKLPLPLRYLANILIYVLFVLSNVLLMNLLIAIMNNTYEKVQAESKTEWAFARVSAILEYSESNPAPAPLNLIHCTIRWLRRKIFGEASTTASDLGGIAFDNAEGIMQKELHDAQVRALAALRSQSDDTNELPMDVGSTLDSSLALMERVQVLEHALEDVHHKALKPPTPR